jgi:hypothetical protein
VSGCLEFAAPALVSCDVDGDELTHGCLVVVGIDRRTDAGERDAVGRAVGEVQMCK